MGRDFFDDDLVKKREKAPEINMGPADGVDPNEAAPSGVSDLNLTRMAAHREMVEEQVAAAAQELERLRQKQNDIEREKRDLEDLRKKQQAYTDGRSDMLEHLGNSLVRLEKEEIKTQQLLEVIGAARHDFKESFAEIEAMDEDSWSPEDLQEELNRALTTLEAARMNYNKTMARIEAVSPEEKELSQGDRISFEGGARIHERSFGAWMKIGFALTLPLLLALIALAILYHLQAIGTI